MNYTIMWKINGWYPARIICIYNVAVNSNSIVVSSAFVKRTWEACGTLRTAEEETFSPKNEERQSDWNSEE